MKKLSSHFCTPTQKGKNPKILIILGLFLSFSTNQVFAVLKTSTGTGLWNTGATWIPAGVPAAGDDVVIAAGHTVTINVSTAALLSLTVNGTLIVGNSNTNRILTVSGNVLINNLASLITAGNGGNTCNISGNITNNGTYDARIGGATMTTVFNGTANQFISGNGATNDFNLITINNTGAAANDLVEITSTNFTALNGFLTLTNGVLKVSGTYILTNNFFTTAGYTIPAFAGLWIDNPNVTVTAQNANVSLAGFLQIDQGNYNVGTAISNSINATNAASRMIINGGSLTVAGRLRFSNGNYTQTSGTVFVSNIGNASGTLGSFQFLGPGNFTMSGGTIILMQEANTIDYYNSATGTTTITGGVLQIGDAVTTTGSTFNIRGSMPALTINATANTKQAYTANPIFVYGNINIQTGSELYCNSIAGTGYLTSFYGATITNSGNIIGTGANSLFGFYGTVAQSYSGTGTFGTLASPFRSLGIEILNSNNVTFSAPVYSIRYNLVNGTAINSNQLTVGNGIIGTVQRGGTAGINAGSFDANPIFNTGANYVIRYDNANAVVTGFEVPATRTATTIFSNNPNGTTLSGGNMILTGIQLQQGSYDIGADTLIIRGVITKTAGFINAAAGTIDMNGAANQLIPAATFLNNNLRNLVISNTSAGVNHVSLSGAVNLFGVLSFGNVNSKRLNSSGFLTLKSNSTATASVADLTNAGINSGNTIFGNVTVERYLLNARKWRLLSAPTNNATQTIRNSWQENGVNIPGYGFNAADTRADFAARGFDSQGGNTSVKRFNTATSNWDAVDNTNVLPISTERGYITFVAGDRSITFPGSNATTFRTAGTLYMGTQPLINIPANQFAIVGNPYASRLDMRNINTTNLANTFYIWDPSISTLGAINTFYYDAFSASFKNLLASGIYGAANSNNNFIESGMAFLVGTGAAAGTLTFQENDKTAGSAVSNFTSGAPQGISINLLQSSPAVLLDGVMANFDDAYSNSIESNDIKKLNPFGETVSWRTANTPLVIDRRFTVSNEDTLYLNIEKMLVKNYRWELVFNNMDFPGRTAFLLDGYLQTSTTLNMAGTTTVNFTIQNIAGSYAANRFKIVFKQLVVLPVTITTVAATRKANKHIEVLWKTENELNISNYEIERSADGINFSSIHTIGAQPNNGGRATYSHTDLQSLWGDNFYRIKAVGTSGQIQYSTIVKVSALKQSSSISVYPNPVVDGLLQLQFIAQPEGKYSIQLSNASGQLMYNGAVYVTGAVQVQNIVLPSKTTAGAYQLSVIAPNGTVKVQQLLVK